MPVLPPGADLFMTGRFAPQEQTFAPIRLLTKAAVNERAARVCSAHFFVADKISALTIANGSSLSKIASKFLKFCCVPLPGMVTWGTI
jgi:hypothetical protein